MLLSVLALKSGTKIMMMGSSEATIKEATEVPEDAGNDVINDFEEEISQQIEIEHREEYLAKVEQRVTNYEIKIINPRREGKKASKTNLTRPCMHNTLIIQLPGISHLCWS
jgi:ubiquitin-like domain-containing CTD phosphatase 1